MNSNFPRVILLLFEKLFNEEVVLQFGPDFTLHLIFLIFSTIDELVLPSSLFHTAEEALMAKVEESGIFLCMEVDLWVVRFPDPLPSQSGNLTNLWEFSTEFLFFFRRAYTDPYFTGLMEEAYKEWEDLQKQTGVQLVKYNHFPRW